MPLSPRTVDVRFDFPLIFTRDVLAPDNDTLASVVARKEPGRRQRALFVIDDGLLAAHPGLDGRMLSYASRWGEHLEAAGAPVVVPGGEVAKNDPAHLERLLHALHDARIDRHSFVVAAGGGAVLDLVGYAAAITHRGLRLVRLPTTTLAQADSGVGVKNGVNAFGKKNFLGTFAPPFAVLCDPTFLDALPERDRRAGLAEVVKVALVRDGALFVWLTENERALADGDACTLEQAVRRGAELHLEHITTSGDPFEQGSARPLDFGHWAAHKLEAMSDHRLRHGEAVAIGIALDVLYAARVGSLDVRVARRVVTMLQRLGFDLHVPELDLRDASGRLQLLDGLEEFRQHLGGRLTVSILVGIGHAIDVHAVDEAQVEHALAELAALGAGSPRRAAVTR